MCLVPSAPSQSAVAPAAPPPLPPEPQAVQQPDNGDLVSAAGRRATDRLRAGAATILTSGQGVTTTAPTAGKTLLGQ